MYKNIIFFKILRWDIKSQVKTPNFSQFFSLSTLFSLQHHCKFSFPFLHRRSQSSQPTNHNRSLLPFPLKRCKRE
ncbi:hypothetical protein HanRHA438_Chr05g0223641 [Helianthus annuus]|uniref:Uncharacterized protein n=1 Tax=Helianthus annuus TaxID=4232 RepID=A0A251UMC4_HELAN|nr:hypothetical protein HanXRQr2_Chr05g0214321 [Helianthus annuus]KAJ0576981.1 hypothetical protein HanIR_Chr05g0230611 [Helianthus annuus]KAJ0584548.1 hypothetical protein HanHA89_Chr05g0189851 [Helianthus annuus]KAJ0750211.1 hypothetical protein HanLR1_Chr05g0179241 [Helianthus annuus]KAJ0918931.1 hypothetical protein HanRHA438_Chr05g0223641 [Helianthus annuus]